jgi:SPP1 gp7 family putative phage head morphogenesis protein
MFDVSDDPQTFDEAIEFFRQKLGMSAKDYYALEEALRAQAFTVSGVADLDLIQQVFTSLDKAIEKGKGFAVFQREVKESLEAAWGRSDKVTGWRIENIYRTSTQSAFSAGRYKQQTEPDALELRPYWQFSAVLDGNTSAICSKANGVVLRNDDPWWNTHIPPLHFSCRSAIRTLKAKQAERIGITSKIPGVESDEGFGYKPDSKEYGYKPKKSKYDKKLVKVAKKKKIRLDDS